MISSILGLLGGDFLIGVIQSVALDGHPCRGAGEFDVAPDDDVAVLLIQLDGGTAPFGLLTGDQGAAAAAERVEHQGVAHRRVHDRVGQEGHRFHGRMFAVLLGLVEFPDGRFLAPGVPQVLSLFLPSEEHRLVLPLVGRASEHQRLLFPDAGAREVETRLTEGLAEVQPLGIGMKHIDGCIVGHMRGGVGEGIEQELGEGVVAHVVVLDLSGRPLVVDVVRGIGNHQVRFGVRHEQLESLGLGAVTTYQAVPSQFPEVPSFGDCGLLELGGHVEVIVVHAVCKRVLEQVVDLCRVEAGERYVEVQTLQIGDEKGQLVLVPLSADLVHGDVEGFFLVGVQFDEDAVLLGHPHILEDVQPLVTRNDGVVVCNIDHDELDVAELLERPLQFLVLGISALEALRGLYVAGFRSDSRIFCILMVCFLSAVDSQFFLEHVCIQFAHLFPCKEGVAEMAVAGGKVVYGTAQPQLLDDVLRLEAEDCADSIRNLLIVDISCSEGVYMYRDRFGLSDCIRDCYPAALGKTS